MEDKSKLLNSNIYDILAFTNELKRKHIKAEDDNSLLIGLPGYIGDLSAHQLQSNIITSAEWLNEIFPIRARLDKSLLTHAMMAQLTDLNAYPSIMDMVIGVREEDLLNNMVAEGEKDVFVLDKKTIFDIEGFEFHLEYDVKIYKQKSVTNVEDVYIGVYDMIGKDFPIGTIKQPYLLPPIRMKLYGEDFIVFRARTRQMNIIDIEHKFISPNMIDNKTFEFDYIDQLAYFSIKLKKSNGSIVNVTPLYDKTPILDKTNVYCHYTFEKNNVIRLIFNAESYIPRINDELYIEVVTTLGEDGNFKYRNEILITPKSDRYVYSNILLVGTPSNGEASEGYNKKTTEDLRIMIPRKLLQRNAITCIKDLNNFFNSLNNKNNKLVFLKSIDNPFTRKYYSYLLLKDQDENIVPTNTIDINMNKDQFDIVNDDRLIIKPGKVYKYLKKNKRCERTSVDALTSEQIHRKEYDEFLYSTPFTFVVNKSPLIVSTYLTIFDRSYDLTFTHVNNQSDIQFLATKVDWVRELNVDSNIGEYKLSIDIVQNIEEDRNLIETDKNGLITRSKIKMYGVFFKEGKAFRYTQAEPQYVVDNAVNFQFKVQTNDNINRKGEIELLNLKDIGFRETMKGFLPGTNIKFEIYVLVEDDVGYGENILNNYVPGLNGHTLCNRYEVINGLDFFINYSEVMSAKIKLYREELNDPFHYRIDSIPVVKYSYMKDRHRLKYLINYITSKKAFMDVAISLLENQFGLDLKFFNTYGPSEIYYMGQSNESLDRVNINLSLNVKFTVKGNDAQFITLIKKEIKNYVEDIYSMDTFHYSNITTHLKNKFDFIQYIEYIRINKKMDITEYQSIIEKLNKPSRYVPEFINIGMKAIQEGKSFKYEPDIVINVL